MSLVSVCGPVNDRDCRMLLKLNARVVEGNFAIRVLRGEEYFVVIENLAVLIVSVVAIVTHPSHKPQHANTNLFLILFWFSPTQSLIARSLLREYRANMSLN